VTRHLKKGRVMTVAPVSPPKDFSAGSVLERQSSLLRPTLDGNEAMAFLKPDHSRQGNRDCHRILHQG
jgi:hypothetical protein